MIKSAQILKFDPKNVEKMQVVLLKIYRNFKAIEPTAWLKIVRYYERHEADIRELDFEEYFDCLVAYTEALFQSSQSAKHLVMTDVVIDEIFAHNVSTWRGDDIFTHMLFQKAASHFNLDETRRAAHVLHELIKLQPYHKPAKQLLFRCKRAEKPAFLRKMRVAALFAFFLAVPIIAMEMFVVQPFFPIYDPWVRGLWWSLFVLGWLFLIAGDGLHFLRVRREIRDTLRRARSKQKIR